MRDMTMARMLGWASVAIAATEVLGQGKVERNLLGVKQQPRLLRGLGLRELVSGGLILSQKAVTPMLAGALWSRVAGDAMDLALLARAGVKTRKPTQLATSTLMVLGITALDIFCAANVQKRLSRQQA